MGTRGKNLCVVFDGPPGPVSGHFVEVEDLHGNGASFGNWTEDTRTGLWRLGPIHTFDDACLAKCEPGEPIFVLRGQDMLAPHAVRDWAHTAYFGASHISQEKYDEALACAAAMENWRTRKMPD